MSADERCDVVTLLVNQHGRIGGLFEQVATVGAERRREPFEALVRLLAVHESAEEHVVHPVARRMIGCGDEIVESRRREERDVRRALAELCEMGVEHPQFMQKLAALAETVTAHARTEEDGEFAGLRRAVWPVQLRSMAEAVRAAELIVPQPCLEGGATEPVPRSVGLPRTVFDRARELVRIWRASKGRSRRMMPFLMS